MADRTRCPACDEQFAAPSSARLLYLQAAGGVVILAGSETPVHRCSSVTRDEEQLLLQDAHWMLERFAPPT